VVGTKNTWTGPARFQEPSEKKFAQKNLPAFLKIMSASRRTPPAARATVKRVALEADMHVNRSGVYSTEELLLFRRVFEGVLARLPAVMRTADARSAIARNILDCAATGERDPVELRIAALNDRHASAA
jgi:hypothetical protein